MTVPRTLPARYGLVWRHPVECEVCGGDEQVGFSPVGSVNQGGRRGGPHLRFEASRLTTSVACPHCTGARGLVGLLSLRPAAVGGGAA